MRGRHGSGGKGAVGSPTWTQVFRNRKNVKVLFSDVGRSCYDIEGRLLSGIKVTQSRVKLDSDESFK